MPIVKLLQASKRKLRQKEQQIADIFIVVGKKRFCTEKRKTRTRKTKNKLKQEHSLIKTRGFVKSRRKRIQFSIFGRSELQHNDTSVTIQIETIARPIMC